MLPSLLINLSQREQVVSKKAKPPPVRQALGDTAPDVSATKLTSVAGPSHPAGPSTPLKPVCTDCDDVLAIDNTIGWQGMLGTDSPTHTHVRHRQQALKSRFLPEKWQEWRQDYAAAAGILFL
ncbi:hypothetical protein WJX72_010496 [[Myrmecia] bisecta]|uniref:Uncharacterized protein n=1 Tax=[Myrmecia] bisecta TaxID=41462 RepID=A0AAW1PLW1_9CHLO